MAFRTPQHRSPPAPPVWCVCKRNRERTTNSALPLPCSGRILAVALEERQHPLLFGVPISLAQLAERRLDPLVDPLFSHSRIEGERTWPDRRARGSYPLHGGACVRVRVVTCEQPATPQRMNSPSSVRLRLIQHGRYYAL